MKKMHILLTLSIIVFLIIFIYCQNNLICITKININSNRLPQNFTGMKILQISDLHSKMFYKNQSTLISNIKKAKPDIIVITGDLIDSRKYNEKATFIFIDKISDIAPIYYVTGNHEFSFGKYYVLENKLKLSGIHILRNENVSIERDGQRIVIAGIDDPSFYKSQQHIKPSTISNENIKTSLKNMRNNSFKILLAHHPEMFPVYANYNFDLIFSGHAHGGQFRLPFIGGLFAPDQGFFPKYTSGKYIYKNSVMVVSRGLGNSVIPLRIFNRPEIVVVTLNKH